MRRFLLSVSLLLGTLPLFAQGGFLPAAEGEKRSYAATMEFRGAAVSGICIVKHCGSEVAGSMVNEFGVKMLDFVYTLRNGKIECRNVIKMMDKWYIRKVVKADLKFLFTHDTSAETKRYGLTVGDDGCRLENKRYDIAYEFTAMN